MSERKPKLLLEDIQKQQVSNRIMKAQLKKSSHHNSFTKKIKIAVKELNDVKAGKIQAKSFDDLLKEL